MNKVNILVVEDDEEINHLLCTYLKKEGYNVYSVMDGNDALIKYNERNYHLIILDIMIPKVDGIEVMKRIRAKSTTPIVILSAKDGEVDKIVGLKLGADDYITKPFSMAELIARVDSHIRRSFYFNKIEDIDINENIIYGDIELDKNQYKVIKNGIYIALTVKEFEILKLFLENPNRVFTKAQIFNNVWENEYICDENTVMVHIRRLRTKIEDDASNPKYINTVWGIGYKLGDIKNA